MGAWGLPLTEGIYFAPVACLSFLKEAARPHKDFCVRKRVLSTISLQKV
jgi:hypothetical protein